MVGAGISGGMIKQQQVDTMWKYLSAEARELADSKPSESEKAAAAKAAARQKDTRKTHWDSF